jgi:glycerol-3-phosphate acyltransferase PlsY
MLGSMDAMALVTAGALVLAGYLIGSIPFGIVVARLVGGPDPRTLGSGRTGGANVVRALGPRAGIAAGLLDAAKGAVAALLPALVGAGPVVQVLAALAAILGHSRSVYIRFGGGRGIAPAFGGLVVIQPLVALVAIVAFVAVLVVSRISSLASLTASALACLALLAAVVGLGMHPAFAVFALVATAMIWLFHRDNIQRLITGSERRIEWRR